MCAERKKNCSMQYYPGQAKNECFRTLNVANTSALAKILLASTLLTDSSPLKKHTNPARLSP